MRRFFRFVLTMFFLTTMILLLMKIILYRDVFLIRASADDITVRENAGSYF